MLAYKTSGGTQLGQIEARPFVWVTVKMLICMQVYRPHGSTGLTLSHTLIYVLTPPPPHLFPFPPPTSFFFITIFFSSQTPCFFLLFSISFSSFSPCLVSLLLKSLPFLSCTFFQCKSFFPFFLSFLFFLLISNSLFSNPQFLYPLSSFFHINSQCDK